MHECVEGGEEEQEEEEEEEEDFGRDVALFKD